MNKVIFIGVIFIAIFFIYKQTQVEEKRVFSLKERPKKIKVFKKTIQNNVNKETPTEASSKKIGQRKIIDIEFPKEMQILKCYPINILIFDINSKIVKKDYSLNLSDSNSFKLYEDDTCSKIADNSYILSQFEKKQLFLMAKKNDVFSIEVQVNSKKTYSFNFSLKSKESIKAEIVEVQEEIKEVKIPHLKVLGPQILELQKCIGPYQLLLENAQSSLNENNQNIIIEPKKKDIFFFSDKTCSLPLKKFDFKYGQSFIKPFYLKVLSDQKETPVSFQYLDKVIYDFSLSTFSKKSNKNNLRDILSFEKKLNGQNQELISKINRFPKEIKKEASSLFEAILKQKEMSVAKKTPKSMPQIPLGNELYSTDQVYQKNVIKLFNLIEN